MGFIYNGISSQSMKIRARLTRWQVSPALRNSFETVPGVMAADWFSRWNKSYKAGEINRQVCVHAFVDDKEVWQYLPWNHRGWHAGGSANNTHIGFEICEPAGFSYKSGPVMVGYDAAKQEDYFRKAWQWQNAVELCVMLCREYGLDENDIICHCEGYKLGIASNHADVMHWFPKHGESMDTFRKAVKKALENNTDNNTDIGIGDLVEFKDSAKNYYPGSVAIPSWVKNDYYHRVTQTLYGGKPVVKCGKECVLLGKKVKKSGGLEVAGINTWVANENLVIVDSIPDNKNNRTYKVQKGNTLWRIAEKELGRGTRYLEIKKLNGLTSDTIYPGQVLKLSE